MTRTKSTLGRIWARYYNWYGMIGKLKAALLQHGWMEERINNYDWANHLTVNPDHCIVLNLYIYISRKLNQYHTR